MTDGTAPPAPTPEDRPRLLDLLRRLGATDAEAEAAVAANWGGDFAVDLALRTGPPVTVEEAAHEIGLAPEEFLAFWHALGMATPPDGAAVVPADLVAALPIVSRATREWIGEENALGIARVVGSTASRLAETLVDSFRIGFEVPQLTAGSSYPEVVEQYVDIARLALPGFLDFLAAVIKAHLVRVASGAWLPAADNRSTSRTLFVGFVDLVGYTALARTATAGELARMLAEFEEVVSAAVTTGHGRIVKQLGDGAMFVCDDATDGCRLALALCAQLATAARLPPSRIGADFGSVVSLLGDYYGDVVNRAARLVALARPGTVVVTDAVADVLDDKSFGLERLPAQALKGFGAPAVTYRLLDR